MKQAIIYILSFLGIISQMSCDDQLNALPTQSKVVGNVIVDQKSAEVALNGVYYRFAQGGDDRNTPSILRALKKFYWRNITTPSDSPVQKGKN